MQILSNQVSRKQGERQSNFELLRLLCMLMVLNLHSFWGYSHGTGILQALDFLRESTSICAVDTFVLISGYFGIKWKARGLFNLLFQILFYSFAVYAFCVFTGILEFEKGEFLHCFKAFYDNWTFITYYIILYFFSPCLNAFAEKSDNRQLTCFIIVIWISEIFVMRSSGVFNYFLVYLIGRWINKNGIKCYSKSLSFYGITTLIIFVCSYSLYLLFGFDAEQMCGFVFGYSYANPFIILQSIFLFFTFSKMNIQSRTINWCASSCLSIYLIHMHPAINVIGYYAFTESLYMKPLFEHVAILFVLMLLIFFCSILIDKVRLLISNITYHLLEISWNCIKGDRLIRHLYKQI